MGYSVQLMAGQILLIPFVPALDAEAKKKKRQERRFRYEGGKSQQSTFLNFPKGTFVTPLLPEMVYEVYHRRDISIDWVKKVLAYYQVEKGNILHSMLYLFIFEN